MDKFQVNDITVTDIPAIARYLAVKSPGVYSEADWLEKLQWIWIDNPFIAPGHTLGWLIIDPDRVIYGVLGNIPVQCVVNKEITESYWATTWFVDENVRNESLGLFMRYLKQKGLLMSNTPNASVEKMLVKLFKYKQADSPWFLGSYLFPLKPVKGFFSVKKTSAGYLKKMAVCVMGSLLKIPQAIIFLGLKINGSPKELSITRVHDFSGETDAWFQEFINHHSCTTLRSAIMYRWIFGHQSQKKNCKVFQVSYNEQVQGYFAFKTRYNPGSGFNYIELVDEAMLPLPDKIKKAVGLKLYHELNKTAKNESLLVMRSNDETMRSSFRNRFGIPVKKVEKTYYRGSFLKPGEKPFLTSIDGDSIFF